VRTPFHRRNPSRRLRNWNDCPRFIISRAPREIIDDDATEGSSSHVIARSASQNYDERVDTGVEGGPRRNKKEKREGKKKLKGANKGRRWTKVHDELNLCWRLASGKTCEFGSECVLSLLGCRQMARLIVILPRCRFTHDIPAYLAQKTHDIHFPRQEDLSTEQPFVLLPSPPAPAQDDSSPRADRSLDMTTSCAIYGETGVCRHGFKCRFLGSHVTCKEDGSVELKEDEELKATSALTAPELNFLSINALKLIRTKKVGFFLISKDRIHSSSL
jgi:tRNA-dihydrouridine synthase 3